MSAVFKGEMSAGELETNEEKRKIRELFREQLKILSRNKKEA